MHSHFLHTDLPNSRNIFTCWTMLCVSPLNIRIAEASSGIRSHSSNCWTLYAGLRLSESFSAFYNHGMWCPSNRRCGLVGGSGKSQKEFYQNRPSFEEDTTQTFGLLCIVISLPKIRDRDWSHTCHVICTNNQCCSMQQHLGTWFIFPGNMTRRMACHAFAAHFWSEHYTRQIKHKFCTACVNFCKLWRNCGFVSSLKRFKKSFSFVFCIL